MNDDDLFRAAVGDVRPIRVEKRAEQPRRARPTEAQLARRQAALHGIREEMPLEPPQLIHPFDPIEGHREGMQAGVLRKLRLGQYGIEARLVLTGYGPRQALAELLQFVRDCRQADVRTALVQHGRASRAEAPANRLRSLLSCWLPLVPEVLAFHSASERHGGLAATYLLISKSERAREANRELQRKGHRSQP